MKRYTKYIRANLLYFIVGPILMLTEVLGEVLLPYFMNLTIKHIESDGAKSSYVFIIGLVMIVTAAIMMFGGVGGNYFSAKASAGFAAGLRKDVLTASFQTLEMLYVSNQTVLLLKLGLLLLLLRLD